MSSFIFSKRFLFLSFLWIYAATLLAQVSAGNSLEQTQELLQVAKTFRKQGVVDSAKYYANKALILAKKHQYTDQITAAHSALCAVAFNYECKITVADSLNQLVLASIDKPNSLIKHSLNSARIKHSLGDFEAMGTALSKIDPQIIPEKDSSSLISVL